MAEHGLTIPQMKAISGHTSDTVLQQYINESKGLKRGAEDVLAIGNKRQTTDNNSYSNSNSNKNHNDISYCSLPSNITYNITINITNSTITGNVNIGYEKENNLVKNI